ncbi:MAG: hypothetical protein BWY74_00297 [Firmicutes bacterium ADurb.Bin419]|nr:MAG: hypothetical protein BWY74_00297 [Firmicutes bacterium ADurb.Bin419]
MGITLTDLPEKEETIFENLYNKYWNSIHVDSKKVIFNCKEIYFNKDELFCIKQKIILDWMYFYLINGLIVDITPEDLKHPQTWDVIRYAAVKKYGNGTVESNIVASNTIGIDLNDYIRWREGREYFINNR